MEKGWLRIRDKSNGHESKEVGIEEVIFNQYDIEFEFTEPDEYGVYCTLPYKDFLFFRDDYEVILRFGKKKVNK